MAGPKFLKLFLFMCITVQIVIGQKKKHSLAIVFDVTSSMSDEINSLRQGVKLLVESFTSRPDNPISDYIFVQFRDEQREPTILPTIVETDANEIYKHLEAFGINPGRNGDCLESCFRGIKYGLEKATENSIMFVFTDAGTKHKEMKAELEKLIQQKKVTVYFFLTEGCGRQSYEIQYYYDLAASSNGLVFDVDYRQISEHFPKYREMISDKLEITGQIQGPAGTSIVPVDVDSSMKEFMFTIVAPKPLITIYDPNNNPINDYEVLTNLTTIKMIKVKNPEPGKWTVQIEATTPYSGQVSVISDLSFKYGFAVHEPNSISQTSFSPLAGQNNYLAILPSDSSLIRNLEYVVLDTKTGPHQFPLRKKTVAEGDLYITDAIELPKIAFKVMLHGIDPISHAIKRLLSPDIASQLPDKPGATIVPKLNIEEGDPIYLICRVDSMVNTTVSWWKLGQNSALKLKTFMQSDILNYTIAEADLRDAGDYNCVANNIAGETISTTIVNVNRTILSVNTPMKKYLPEAGTRRLVLKCVVTPKTAGVNVYWEFNDSPVLPHGTELNLSDLVLKNIDPSFTGIYTCVAQKRSQIKQDKIEVNVQYESPFLLSTFGLVNSTNTNNVNILGVTVLNRVQVPSTYFNADYEQIIKVNEGQHVLLECNMGGIPIPTVDWFKNNVNLNKQTAFLELANTTIETSGIYKCVGKNSYGNNTVISYLNVQKQFTVVSATSTKPVYQQGDEIKFTCKTKGNQLPVIIWEKKEFGVVTNIQKLFEPNSDEIRKQVLQQDYPLYLNGGEVIEFSEIDTLERYGKISYEFTDGEYLGTLEYVIKSANFSDAGDYMCVTHIDSRRVEKSCLIKVVDAPFLENAETKYSISQGIKSYKIKCPIKGTPNPTIEWYHETTVITSNQNFNVQNDFLEFKSPMQHHEGQYSCRGTNIGGSLEFKLKVIIFMPITDVSNLVLNGSRKTKLEIKKNETKVIECSVTVTPVYWSRIINGNPNKQRQFLEANLTYNFYADMSQDIMCSKDADPKFGEIFEITVIEKPTILSTKTNIEVNLDDILRLECNATGEPKPIIKWYKYERGQQHDIVNYPGFNANGEILFKRYAENSDTTKYMCTAQNKLGNVSHMFDVIILNDLHYFSSWSDWSTCTKTCGQGIQFKTRNCLRASCNRTRQREERQCTTIECAVDGGWSDFSPYSECSKTCAIDLNYDIPTKQSRRECNNPLPAFGGKYCAGKTVRILNCAVPLCNAVGSGKLKYPPCLDQPICCPIGFEYDNNTLGCKETDICKRKGPYSACRTDNQKCQNVGDDDYECVCRPGYKLWPSLRKNNPKYPRCMDINECKQEPYPCGSGKCANSPGSYSCI